MSWHLTDRRAKTQEEGQGRGGGGAPASISSPGKQRGGDAGKALRQPLT